MAEHEGHSEESTRLRRCIRDLVALTALPAVWMSSDALQTAESLAEVMLEMLRLDFVYLSLRGKNAANAIEVGRFSGRPREGGPSRALSEAVKPWLEDGSRPPSSLPDPLGGEAVPVAVIRLGPEGTDGVLVAGRRDPDFPSEVDRLLLGVGVNQAAVLLQRKEAEEALEESEAQFRLIVESVKDYAIFALDLEGRVTSWNTGAERLFGYREAEIVGQSGSLIYTTEDRDAGVPEEELGRAAETGRGEDERWHLRKDGSRLFVSGVMTAIYGAAGDLRGFTKVARDITERMRAEEERRAAPGRGAPELRTAPQTRRRRGQAQRRPRYLVVVGRHHRGGPGPHRGPPVAGEPERERGSGPGHQLRLALGEVRRLAVPRPAAGRLGHRFARLPPESTHAAHAGGARAAPGVARVRGPGREAPTDAGLARRPPGRAQRPEPGPRPGVRQVRWRVPRGR